MERKMVAGRKGEGKRERSRRGEGGQEEERKTKPSPETGAVLLWEVPVP